MPRPARVSPDRILAAAALEFAERGFGGARVDRIARRARVNKAMLYYHFGSKQALYRALLRAEFGAITSTVRAVSASGAEPRAMLATLVRTVAAHIEAHPYFPSIMLREVAEGGAHLDAETLSSLASVPQAFADLLRPGIQHGAFRTMHPLSAYFTMIGPILMFIASRPVRQRLSLRRAAAGALHPLETDAFLSDFATSLQRALAADDQQRTR